MGVGVRVRVRLRLGLELGLGVRDVFRRASISVASTGAGEGTRAAAAEGAPPGAAPSHAQISAGQLGGSLVQPVLHQLASATVPLW